MGRIANGGFAYRTPDKLAIDAPNLPVGFVRAAQAAALGRDVLFE
jgi:hypothetical protein